jgi:opacity protein-like surface antigen
MMTRVLGIAGLAAALAVLPSAVQAQDASKLSFGVMGGLSLPMGDFGDAAKSGFNITGSIFAPLGDKLRLRGDIGYESFEPESGGGDNLNVLSFAGNVMFPLGAEASAGGARPYLIGGAGLYRFSCDGCDSETDFGINVGGGIEFKLAGFTTYAEARLVNAFSDPDATRWIPLTFGIRF